MQRQATFFSTTSSRNLASLFHGTDPGPTVVASTAAYVAPKQPKKGIDSSRASVLSRVPIDSPPKIMTATIVQALVL